MLTSDIIALVTSILLVIGGVVLLTFISKKRTVGVWWITPFTILFGWVVQYYSGESDTYWGAMWDTLLWAFILSMIIVNVKVLIYGSKSGFKRGKELFTGIKTSFMDVKATFTKKSSKNDVSEVIDELSEDIYDSDDIEDNIEGENNET